MPRAISRYVCQQCGHESPRWMGRCPECGEWNSLVEEVVAPIPKRSSARQAPVGGAQPVRLTEVSVEALPRLSTGMEEMDRVLGGGIVPGSLVLLGGDPGVGKSTLLTQVADILSHEQTVLYVSGEESAHQIKLRAKRLGVTGANLYVLAETHLEAILGHIHSLQPALVIVDSIQTTQVGELESAPGTVAQVRACGVALQRVAKEQGIAVFLVGHVTKEGALAGPKALEHLVDTVLTFEGDPHLNYRILRATKNRFGSTDEVALFEMREQGLVAVQNPSEWLLSERASHSPGSVVTAIMEGTRPLLVEVQALVTHSYLSQPRRQVTGLDYNRVNMVLAVLEKRAGMRLSDKDVFVNAAGGIFIREPSADLAVALAVVSSLKDRPLPPDMVVFGELGLAGEVRSVIHTEQRVREAQRLGFSRVMLPRRDARALKARGLEISLDGTYTIRDAVGVVTEG
ncbi:MAG: DNA repair protein RadA [Armatimonadota bacterium]|nr:MAG: DNA repair protein RadA [Armatimonadota bacterium]